MARGDRWLRTIQHGRPASEQELSRLEFFGLGRSFAKAMAGTSFEHHDGPRIECGLRHILNRSIRVRTARQIFAFVAILVYLAPTGLEGQALPAVPDTTAATGPAGAAAFHPPYSGRGAFFRSLVLPGWGQAYVGAPARGAVYFALAAGSGWMTYLTRQQYNDARVEEQWLRDTGQIGENEDSDFALARSQHFEDWAALTIFLMFLSGADAYVSAYLADFDETVTVRPATGGGVRFEAQLPVGRGR
jgi:hypothetical protein